MQQPINKPLSASPSFPFSFVYRDTKTEQSELPDHFHDWYELVYVHAGKGTFFIDQTFYDMQSGSLFIIPSNTIHRAFPDTEDPVTSTALFFSSILLPELSLNEPFSYLNIFNWSKKKRTYKLNCNSALQAIFESCLSEINEELQTAEVGYRHAILLLVQRILLKINRDLIGELWQSAPSAVGPSWMRDALLFIDKHYTEDIKLHELCKRASVSPAHFSRVFKQMTGMNVTKFVAAKRMIRAKNMLLATGENVGSIAAECGFESLPHFHRIFKRIVGKTPAAFRRQRL